MRQIRTSVLLLSAMMTGLAAPSLTRADLIAFTDASTGSGPGGFGAGGAVPLNIGHEFTVTGGGINVTSLGVFDFTTSTQSGTGGLASSHVVTLFQVDPLGTPSPTTVTPLASVTVPAGTAAPYESGFRFATIPSTFLPAGDYAVIAYDLTASDPYGDPVGGNESFGLPAPGNNIKDFRYDPYVVTGTPPASPTFPNGDNGDTNEHASASFLFTNVPEPTSAILFGAAGFVLASRRGSCAR